MVIMGNLSRLETHIFGRTKMLLLIALAGVVDGPSQKNRHMISPSGLSRIRAIPEASFLAVIIPRLSRRNKPCLDGFRRILGRLRPRSSPRGIVLLSWRRIEL